MELTRDTFQTGFIFQFNVVHTTPELGFPQQLHDKVTRNDFQFTQIARREHKPQCPLLPTASSDRLFRNAALSSFLTFVMRSTF
jgi:hypothetical protein